MTNEVLTQTSTLAHAPSDRLVSVVLRDPVPWGSLSLVLVPICAGVFFHAWLRVRRKRNVSLHTTFFKLSALTMATAMVSQISTSLYYSLYDSATLVADHPITPQPLL